MNVDEIDAILKALRQKMSDEEDDATFYAMRDATKAIRSWLTTGGDGELPYAVELRQWGLLAADNEADTMDGADRNLASLPEVPAQQAEQLERAKTKRIKKAKAATTEQNEMASTHQPPEPETAGDSDDGLQDAYDEAVVLLNNARYAAARDAFAALETQAVGRLRADVARYYEEAEAHLAEQVRTRIEKAESHTEKQPNDYKGQRRLWDKVREVEPENETARAALQRLEELEQGQKTAQDIERLRENADHALQNLRLTELNRWLGEAESLQQNNDVPHLQPVLDDLVQHISRDRKSVV